uniref:Uncharacterized protein n=1 Tax=Oryza barthii TaxID=65489 RepID=A0A0D3FUK2_9ORYZ
MRDLNGVGDGDYRVLLDAGGAKLFADGHAHYVILCAAMGLLSRLGHVVQRIVVEVGPAG